MRNVIPIYNPAGSSFCINLSVRDLETLTDKKEEIASICVVDYRIIFKKEKTGHFKLLGIKDRHPVTLEKLDEE